MSRSLIRWGGIAMVFTCVLASAPASAEPMRDGVLFFRGGIMQTWPYGDTEATEAEFGTEPGLGLWLEAGGNFSPHWGLFAYLSRFGGTVDEPRPSLLESAPDDASFGLDRGLSGFALRLTPWGVGTLSKSGFNPYFSAGLGVASIEAGSIDAPSEAFLSSRSGLDMMLGAGIEFRAAVGDARLPDTTLDFSLPLALALSWHPVVWSEQSSSYFEGDPSDAYSLSYVVLTLTTGFEIGH